MCCLPHIYFHVLVQISKLSTHVMFKFWAKLKKFLKEFTYIAPKICVDLPMVQGKCGRTAILVNNLIDNMVILLFFGTSLDTYFLQFR